MKTFFQYTNQLINETSPYLLQHAHNPVNWFAWGKEAFDKARQEDKPIYLSIGYSTCYWCHAMEKECFEDEDAAKVLNEHFISIKVDREERPDIDELYMLATQIMTSRGGWPNSVWLTTAGKPWMTGSYFPKEQFIEFLDTLIGYWKNQRQDVEKQADGLTDAIRQIDASQITNTGPIELAQGLLDKAVTQYEQDFDNDFGGFGGAPKFPPHGALRILIHEYRRTNNKNLLRMITQTLDNIYLGGIHDHIGGGFARYSTDNKWLLPHFEKMLYDNAQLMRSFADGYLITGSPHYRDAVENIFNWLQREMTSPQGGFYSAVDAGEFGKEGETYLWHYDEIVDILGEKDAVIFAEIYNIKKEGNFTEEHSGKSPPTNIIYLKQPDLNTQTAEMRAKREKLLEKRNTRPHLHIDDKILTGANGLMIGSLAYAGRQLNDLRYTQAASKAADFISNYLMDNQEHLLHTYRLGKAKIPAFLDDYAYLAEGFLELYKTSNELRWLENLKNLAQTLINEFEDKKQGGFFYTAQSREQLLMRSRNLMGGGNIPSANGIAALVLLELGQLIANIEYEQSAKHALESLSPLLSSSPRSIESALYALAVYLQNKK